LGRKYAHASVKQGRHHLDPSMIQNAVKIYALLRNCSGSAI
jgi:hypothetical protein